MSESIELTFRLTYDDYRLAVDTDNIRIRYDIYFGLLTLTILGAIVYIEHLFGRSVVTNVLLYLSALSLLFPFIHVFAKSFLLASTWYYRRKYQHLEETNLVLTETRIYYRTGVEEHTDDWSLVEKVCENSDYYSFTHNRKIFAIIPKRAFDDAEQENGFRDLVSRKVGRVSNFADLKA